MVAGKETAVTSSGPDLDLDRFPFSTRGAFLTLSRVHRPGVDRPGWHLRSVEGWDLFGWNGLFALSLLREGTEMSVNARAVPWRLSLRGEAGACGLDAVFQTPCLLRLQGRGATLRLRYDRDAIILATEEPDGSVRVNLHLRNLKLLLRPLRGRLWLEKTERPDPDGHPRFECVEIFAEAGADDTWDLAVEEMPGGVWRVPEPGLDVEECARTARASFHDFADRLPRVAPEWEAAKLQAAYCLWSSLVQPRGALSREAMLMSKNWMTAVWSWDHCFNAMALFAGNPELGWDQFMLLFDARDPLGALPDSVDAVHRYTGHLKPPIHGWALARMMESRPLTAAQVEEVYPALRDWTEFWFRHQDDDGDGIPNYNTGNDSGWDNATPFEQDSRLESPELSCFLILQMDTLAALARLRGRDEEAGDWTRRADRLLEKLIAHSFRGNRPVFPVSGSHVDHGTGTDSLLSCMPLVLGGRLPDGLRRALVERLLEPGGFLTQHGLATERPRSPRYRADGYWRGPIWAPVTLLLVDGLRRAGEAEAAADIALRFCRMCRDQGFAENFDALTGAGLRDRSYTWTASVFLLLASVEFTN